MDIDANQNESIRNNPTAETRINETGGKKSITRHAMPFSFCIALPNGQTYLFMVIDTFVRSKRWNCILDLWRPLGNTNRFSQALSSATFINDLDVTPYPENIKTPNPDMNISASPGRFRYDRDFLLQFMNLCTEKPDSFPSLEPIGLKPYEKPAAKNAGEHRRTGSMGVTGASSLSRQASIGLGLGPGFAKGGRFAMGQFQSPSRGMDSQSRFDASNNTRSSISFGGPVNSRLTPTTRNASQGGVGGGGPREAKRTRSQRGNNRGEGGMRGSGFQTPSQQLTNMNLEPVVPLEISENRWVAGSTQRMPQKIEECQLVERKVTALLNKLTMVKFDSISDQIIAYANRSEQETDGSTLMRVTKRIFGHTREDSRFSEMYARLCRKMTDRVSPNVQDHYIRGSHGQPIAGGMLFRKYLLSRCQEDFERGWSTKEATVVSKRNGEPALYSDEYYAAAKTKRLGLGLIRFMGELFKQQMFTDRIMHECIKKLLSNSVDPEEEEIWSLCALLTVIGRTFDKPKARNHMEIYFDRMNAMVKSNVMRLRMRFLVQDVIELRANRWQPRHAVLQPVSFMSTTQGQPEASPQGAYNNPAEANGRNVPRRVGNQPSARGGDLSQFGKISKPPSLRFGPSSIFAKKDPRPEASRASATNMFSALGTSNPLEGSANNRKASSDLGPGELPNEGGVGSVRKKLNLLPRTKPIETKEALTSPGLH